MWRQRSALGTIVVGAVLAMSVIVTPATSAEAHRVVRKPSAPCSEVQKNAAKLLAADDSYMLATTERAENAALVAEDVAIDRLRIALRGCEAVAMGSACSGLVTTAGQIVAADDALDRAHDSNAEDAALAAQDPAIAELEVRLTDCRAGKVPEPCAASVRSARDVVRAEAQLQKAKNDKAENVALKNQDRAIAALKVRLAGCNAAPTAAACSPVLTAGQRVVDAEDQFHVATTEHDSDAALDQESSAIDDLGSAVATCSSGSAPKSGGSSGDGSDPFGEIFGDTYTADLTHGKGDFPARDMGGYASRYADDGYHFTITSPATWGPAGVQSGLPHSVLSAAVKVDLSAAPADASFGPFCWHDPMHGYGFVLSTSGHAELVRVDGSYSALEVLASSTTASPATRTTLTITCVRTTPVGAADVRLGGYVGSQKVLEAAAPAVEDFQYTGFSGHTETTVPAQWTVSRFERRGPDDLPRDAPR